MAAADISPSALYAASFHDLQGEPVSLGRFSGHPLVLNFWATWCGPCREEMPALSRVSVRAASRVQFVGLAQDDRQELGRLPRRVDATDEEPGHRDQADDDDILGHGRKA